MVAPTRMMIGSNGSRPPPPASTFHLPPSTRRRAMGLTGMHPRHAIRSRGFRSSTAQSLLTKRGFHANAPKQMWPVLAGLGFAGLYVGTRYILRAQERMRRKREGLPLDDDDDLDADHDPARGQPRPLTRLLGLDYGTANLRLATTSIASDWTQPIQILETPEGKRCVDAAVAMDNGTEMVGQLAKSCLARKPGATALAPQLLLGQSLESSGVLDLPFKLPMEMSQDQARHSIKLKLDGETFSSEWASEVLLDHMRSLVSRALGDEPTSSSFSFPLVLSIPPASEASRQEAFLQIAEQAGFQVVSLVEEPLAAMHTVELLLKKQLKRDMIAAVVDMGGFTSSISLVQKQSNGEFVRLASASTTKLSGRVIDDALFKTVTEKFRHQHGIDLSIDHMATYRVLEAVEAAKIELSSKKSTDINLPFITADQTGAKHLVQRVTTHDVQVAHEKPLHEALSLCDQVLRDAHVPNKQSIDFLVCIGAGMRCDHVKQTMEQYFEQEAFDAKDFVPEEAVSVGTVAYARRLLQD